jgi:hypothetical protein
LGQDPKFVLDLRGLAQQLERVEKMHLPVDERDRIDSLARGPDGRLAPLAAGPGRVGFLARAARD